MIAPFVLLLLVATVALADDTANPTALDMHERWEAYVARTFDWKRVAISGAESAVEQSFSVRRCGRPPYCFPHHFSGAVMRRTTRTTLEFGAGALLGEDLRRRPSGLNGFGERVMYALKHAALARGPEGEWRPAYSRFLGTMGAVTVSEAWRGHPLTAGRLSTSVAWSATSYFQDALFAEFEPDLRILGTRAWNSLIGVRGSAHQSRRRLGVVK